ncbi:MAG TPA: TspO/MBR family protein [Fibrobacteria bacterium]|nr:TspO/MBR family protein [Fibrobacteria bacterium]
MRLKELPALLLCLALPLAVGAVSGIATASGLGTWYDGLAKPSFNPPSRVFGPVWTTLYALMGISLFLVRRAPASRERRRALIVFAVQLALNGAWSLVFFRLRNVGLAFAEILLIDAAVAVWLRAAWIVDRRAGMLQLPYLAWVLFASVLNGAILVLNR